MRLALQKAFEKPLKRRRSSARAVFEADFMFRDTAELSLEEFIEIVLQFRGQSPATVKVPHGNGPFSV